MSWIFVIPQCIAINNQKESSKILLGVSMARSPSSGVIQHCHACFLTLRMGLLFMMSNLKSFINNYYANMNMSLLLLSFVVCRCIELVFSATRAIKGRNSEAMCC